MMRRIGSLILLLVLGTACRETPNDKWVIVTPAPVDTVTAVDNQVAITLAVEAFSLNHYRPLVEQFEQQHPNIQVHLVSTGDVTADAENQMTAMTSTFDVFPYSPNRQGDTQYLLDLQPLLALDNQFERDDFLPGLLPDAAEALWAIPTGVIYQLTYFDKRAFDATNRPYPELTWTMDDFLATALVLTERTGDEVTRWGYIPGQVRYSPLLATLLNGHLQSGEELRLTDSDVVTAVQWISDLFTVHQVSPWLNTYKPVARQVDNGEPSNLSLLNSNMAAMWHSTHLLYNETNGNIGITAVPHGTNGFAAEPIITGFAISRGTRSPEAAWQLVNFLSHQLPPDETGLPTPTLVPARRSVAAATGYWQQLPADLVTVLQYTAENSQPSRISYAATEPLLEALALHIDENVPMVAALEQATTAVANEPTPVATEVIVVKEAPSVTVENATEIKFTSYSYLFDEHRLLAEEFHEQHPNIVVDVRLPEDIPGLTEYQSLLNGNTDCFLESGLALHDKELTDAILSIQPLLDADGSIQIDDFYALQTSYFMQNGELLALPAFVVTPLLEYNRDLFREANLPEPSPEWTLADFLEIAQKMTQGTGETKQYGYTEPLETFMFQGLSIFGVNYVDNSGDVPTFDFAAATEMMIWYTDLIRLHKVQSPLTGNPVIDHPLTDDLIHAGHVAMWPYPLSSPTMNPNGLEVEYDVGLVPVPMGLDGSRGDLTSNVHGYYIMVNSPYRDECWQWVTFLTPRPQAIYMKQRVPAHIETVESNAYISSVGEELATANKAFTAFGQPSPHIEEPDWFFPGHIWMRMAYIDIVNGRDDVTTALEEADVKFTNYRQCLIDQDAFDNFSVQLSCALTADPLLSDRPDFPLN
jgi:ABC-type glycerol-3-phosphate transport system substrate-binding protein